MQALAYWKIVTTDKAGFLDRVIALLADSGVRYCVIGGQAVNAFVEPVVSLDLDLAVATQDLVSAEDLLGRHFRVERFPHSVKVSMPGSDLRVQFQTDPRYGSFVDSASERDVLGLKLPVAKLEDVLQGEGLGGPGPGGDARARGRRTSPTSRGSSRPIPSSGAGFLADILSRLI